MQRLFAIFVIACVLAGCTQQMTPTISTQFMPTETLSPTQTAIPATQRSSAPTLVPTGTPTVQPVPTAIGTSQPAVPTFVVTESPVVKTDIRTAKTSFTVGEEIFALIAVLNQTLNPVIFTVEISVNGKLERINTGNVASFTPWTYSASLVDLSDSPKDLVIVAKFTSDDNVVFDPPVVTRIIHILSVQTPSS